MKKLIYLLLSVLGFGAVSCEGGGNLDAYGCPHVDFSITARVVDEEGTPIKGISVEGLGYWGESYGLHSDEQGVIDFIGESMNCPDSIRFVDVDGSENGGEFKEKVVNVEFTQVKEGESWYRGGYEANLGDVTLERVKQEE